MNEAKMREYVISWTEETWYRVSINANSEEDALEMFYDQKWNPDESKHLGGELQGVIVEESV
jgi:hypothetical protein